MTIGKKATGKKPAIGENPAAGKAGETISGLDKMAEGLEAEVAKSRRDFLKNELALKKKVAEKNRAEGQLGTLLRKKFSAEKRSLAAINASASKKQADLKMKIASLERINRSYAEKKAKIKGAKKRHNALKRQLDLLEKRAGELSVYA